MIYFRCPTRFCSYVVLILSFFICWAAISEPAVAAAPSLPAVVAEAAVVMDADTGCVLGSKNSDFKLPMASTTKIVTALLTLEQGQLTDTVALSEEAAQQEGSSMYTSPGETYTVEELLYGLMLNSGNDAAWALAEHMAGDVPAFVQAMNERVRELGALNTHFTNPSGLPDPGHYSTAKDMALIARAAMARADFRRIVGTKAHQVPWPVKDTDKLLVNHNKLLWRYQGADGIKTGYTNEARQCLVASASREDRQLIAVLLKSETGSVWQDAQLLLDWGFANFANHTLVRAGEKLGTVPVKRGQADQVEAVAQQDVRVTLAQGEEDRVQVSLLEVPTELTAPVEDGQLLGKAVFTLGEKEVGQVALVAAALVRRPPKPWWFWFGVLFLLGLMGLLVAENIRRRRRRMRLKWVSFRYRGPK